MESLFRTVTAISIFTFTLLVAAQNRPSLELTSSTDSIVSGDPVEIKVILTNSTNESLSVPIAGGGAHAIEDYDFDVRNVSGHLVARTALGKAVAGGQEGSYRVKTVSPGESVTETSTLSKLFDMTLPGKYSVTAVRKVPINGAPMELKSNNIYIQVTP